MRVYIKYVMRRLATISVLTALLMLMPSMRATAQENVQEPSDSIITSLVTCAPGTLIYEVYGHTAIRVRNITTGADIVYNYGLFDFNSPHFLFRWLRGETDYFVGGCTWNVFLSEYLRRGTSVYLQELNLDNEGGKALAGALLENCKPQNRMYRYDFLYNNCATMALDKIEQAFAGQIEYTLPDSVLSFRDLLHQYNGIEPWNSFGVDLVVGAEADQPITYRQASFAPMRLLQLAQNAEVTDTAGTVRQMANDCQEIAPPEKVVFPDCLITPMQAMILLLLLTILISCIEWNVKRHFLIYDIILFGMQGIIGLVIGFLYFFSSHPTTGTNWLILCLNPLPLVCLPFLIHNLRKNRIFVFLPLNFILLTFFILFSGKIPQYIAPATLVMLASFALRSLSDMHLAFRNGAGYARLSGFFDKKARKATILLALTALSAMPAAAQNVKSHSRPRLVVGIVIDQLDNEYVERLMPLFGEDGFKKLWYNGYNLTNATFNFDCPDRASAIASIYTGTEPFYHGIVSERWMERKTQMLTGAVDDSDEIGINTIDHSSPKRLQVTSIADKIKIAGQGKSLICSVAANRDAAILAGGHEADVVLWMNDSDGQWCSSGYYGGFPSWANDINNEPWQKSEWKPVFPTGAYINDNPSVIPKTFNHTFGRGDTWSMKTSPVANDNITRMALESFKAMELGKDECPDLLAVTFYAGGYENSATGIESLEQQDTYVRLDINIANLIRKISGEVGIDNVLFFVTSTGYKPHPDRSAQDMRMPSGSVNMERVTALLNLYLSALYEKGQYVMAYHDTNLYLDHQLIEDQRLSMQQICTNCVDFLLQMTGIKSVVTQRDLISGNISARTERIRNGLNAACSGDIVIEVTPGWTIEDENRGTRRIAHRNTSTFPIVLYGAGVHPEVNHSMVQASALASTVAWVLGIPAPESCSSAPLTGIR